MVLKLKQQALCFPGRPECVERDAVDPVARCQATQREFQQRPLFECAGALQHARCNLPLQVEIEGAAKYHFRSCHRRKISCVRLPTRLGREKPVRRKRDGKFFAAQARAQCANFLQHDERSRASAPDRRQLEPCWGSAKKIVSPVWTGGDEEGWTCLNRQISLRLRARTLE